MLFIHKLVICGEPSILDHALDCRKGCLIIQRHKEVRDTLGNVATLIYRDMIKRPVVRETMESNSITGLIADLGVQGV